MKYKTNLNGTQEHLTAEQYINLLETRLYNAETVLETKFKFISSIPFGCAERIENWFESIITKVKSWTADKNN